MSDGSPGTAAPAKPARPSKRQSHGCFASSVSLHRDVAESKLLRTGLPAGSLAPDFRLPLLRGGALALHEFRGRQVLLVFSDPHCGPCNALAPRLERRARRTPRVQVLMVSRGEVEENEVKATQHRLSFPILLQRKWEISRAYGMFATPIAFLINEQGHTSSDVAIGVDPILSLLSPGARYYWVQEHMEQFRPAHEWLRGRD